MNNIFPVDTYITSREGYPFSLESRIWKISREYPINLEWIDEILEKNMKESFLRTLAHYAEKYSAAHTNNQNMRFLHFSKEQFKKIKIPVSSISSEALISYRSTLDREHEWYLGSLRGFLKTWIKLGYSGVNEDVETLFLNWRLKGNIKGLAVKTLSPTQGPLSDLEFQALHEKLTEAFETKLINIEDFILAQIFITTGRRPAQIAPLAQAFSGIVIEKESSARRGSDITSRVRSENGNVGTCGHYGFCGAIAPIACYTCRNFQPWLNGPHEEILDTLISERERILAITKDQTIASVNDRTILAVTQVIQICRKRHEQLSVEKPHD